MGLREEQRELTRRKILGAVLELVADGSVDDLSVPDVARRSGVSLATIYRYFPSRSDLLAAASAQPALMALEGHSQTPRAGDDEFETFLRAMWSEFALNLPLLRHQVSSAAGREMRRARLDDGRQRLAEYIEAFGIKADSPEGQRLISLIMTVSSSVALIELHDRQGIAVDEAIESSLWAVDALIKATARATSGESKE